VILLDCACVVWACIFSEIEVFNFFFFFSDFTFGTGFHGQSIIKRFSNKLEFDGFKERIPSFTTGIPGIILTLFSMVLNLTNMYTDVALAIVYFSKDDYWFGSWTLGFVVVPSFFISLYTFILHKKSDGKFLMKVQVSKPVVYSLCLVLHGHMARCIMWLTLLVKKVPLLGVRKALWAFRDITSYAETFTHSLPQLCLQLYVMVIYNGTYTPLQIVCFVSSWLSAAWGIQSQFDGITWKLIAFEINLFWFASRAAAVDMLASVFKPAPFIMISVHFLLMFPLWFWQNKFTPFRKKPGTNRFELIVTDAFYAAIYAGSNTATPITCKYQLPLAILLCIENCLCITFSLCNGKVSRNISHFETYIGNYKPQNITYLKTTYCKNGLDCTVPFKTWQKSSITACLAYAVTIIGFIQVIVITILRWRKVVTSDAMVSKLGSTDFRKKADGRVNIFNSVAQEATSSSSLGHSPKAFGGFHLNFSTLITKGTTKLTRSAENSPVTSPVSSPTRRSLIVVAIGKRVTNPTTKVMTDPTALSTEDAAVIESFGSNDEHDLGIRNNGMHSNNNETIGEKANVVEVY